MQLGKLTFCLKGGETDIYSSLTLTLDYCRGKRLVQLELKLFGININASGKVSGNSTAAHVIAVAGLQKRPAQTKRG